MFESVSENKSYIFFSCKCVICVTASCCYYIKFHGVICYVQRNNEKYRQRSRDLKKKNYYTPLTRSVF